MNNNPFASYAGPPQDNTKKYSSLYSGRNLLALLLHVAILALSMIYFFLRLGPLERIQFFNWFDYYMTIYPVSLVPALLVVLLVAKGWIARLLACVAWLFTTVPLWFAISYCLKWWFFMRM